jgi:ATP-binding cassette subfamily B protein
VLAGNLGGLVLGGLVIGTLATLFELGRLPVSSAAAAVIALRQLFGFVELAGRGGAQLHEAGTFLEDYASFIEQAEASDRRPDPPEVSPFTRLRAQGVSFRYPGSSRPALDGVSLSIEAGRVVALVGENGSGKTTFAKILAGLYRPTTGRLLVDGEEAVPGSVAVLFQDFVRYGFSAADTIGLGDTTRLDDRAAIEEAAAGAGADAMIRSLRSGYDTRLTRQFEDGADLSVGQWQRVALARALFRDAELIILDEPTAALDPKAEAELFDTVRSLAEGRTVVLISHRFSTVRNADEIVVLDHGRIVEQGSHRQLMAAGGPYAELFDLQASAYIDIDREGPG